MMPQDEILICKESMMKVYYAKISPSSKEDTFFAHTGRIEPERLEAAMNIKNEKVRMRSLVAGLLLHAALCDYLQLPAEETPPFQTACGQWGKPFLTDYPDVHFNLSHSGEYVCCAVAGYEVGTDIQRHQEKVQGIAERFFTKADNRLLECSSNEERQEIFFRIWSIRESYIKLTGRGIGQGLDSFDIDWENRQIYDQGLPTACFEEYAGIEGYSLCVCTGQEKIEARWESVDIW